MKDLICLGDALIDFFATKSGIVFDEVTLFQKFPGGAMANVVVGASKLGLKSAFIGRVGDDNFGYYLRDVLKENKVDTKYMQFDKNVRTGIAFIALPTTTTREFLFYRNPSADMMLSSKELNHDYIKDTKIFHFGPLTLNAEPSRSATYEVIKIVRSNPAIVLTYDPNLRISLWPNEEIARKELMKPISLVDVVKLNDEELFFLTQKNNITDGIKFILDKGPKLCVITEGQKGSIYATESFRGNIPTFNVNTIDSTGCGDSFVAGLLKGMVDKGLDILLSMESELISLMFYASAAASLTSMGKGVIPSLPSECEVDDFIKKNVK